MSNILEIKNATVFRGSTCVFKRFSLVLKKGQNTVILGPNGAGKSTLLKILSRELYPVQNADSFIRVYGKDRWDVWELRSRLGLVSHDLQHQYVGNTIGTNIILSGFHSSVDIAWNHKITQQQHKLAQDILKKLGIDSIQNRNYSSMSTGEQRRFLLGRALVNNPETLVLDEPTSGLDLRSCFHYLSIIRKLMADSKTLALVTHHIHEIPPEISRVILLKHGQIVADGAKDAVLTSSNLSFLFDTPVRLVSAAGFYHATPGEE